MKYFVGVIEEYDDEGDREEVGQDVFFTNERCLGKFGPFESKESAEEWADKEAVKDYDKKVYNKIYYIECVKEPQS